MSAAPLIARLEDAETGSIALTIEVVRAFGYHVPDRPMAGWHDPDGKHIGMPPPVTTSLDAALALAERVLPEWGIDIGFPCRLGEHGGRPWASVWPPNNSGLEPALNDKWGRCNPANAAGLPLALCLAILRARPDAPNTHEGDERG